MNDSARCQSNADKGLSLGTIKRVVIARVRNGPPPAYDTLEALDAEASRTEKYFDQTRPKDWISAKSIYNLDIMLAPKILHTWNWQRIFRNRRVQPAWRAVLCVWADNLPRLMRRGFHWSPADITDGAGYILLHDKNGPRSSKDICRGPLGKHVRVYVLEDSGPNSEWKALLIVYADEPSTLTNFDLSWITTDTAYRVTAKNWEHQTVYYAEVGSGHCFNTIYNQIPKGGWWLWPKSPIEEGHNRRQRRNRLTSWWEWSKTRI